ncbi:MAG TPA: PLP-dependent aminotransferase family protein, partial [Steroidobacteraceae bacterium]|nr:PLP-dependent aminotransferase family protein [Steroidobacteraceae bacterium]
RRGAGTFVAERMAVPEMSASHGGEDTFTYRLNEFWLRADVTAAMSFWRDSAESTPPRKGPQVDFRPAMVDSRLFPLDVFRRVSAKQLRGLERRPASYKSPQGNQGNFHLRKAITRHIAVTRAVACQPDDILVTAGAQQAFDLLARALVTPHKTIVALEDPGYPPMRVAFAAAGARLVPVGVDAEGLIIEQLPPDVGVICVTPSHQFPLGVTMSMRRREALIEFARKRNAVIIEDDYDGEFRYEGAPLPALRTGSAADVVFYVGTFSKCMLSALRLGFIVAPGWAIGTLTAAKNCLDWHCPTPVQNAVAAFIAEGHLTRHVRKMRDIYKERRHLLLESLQEKLSDRFTLIPSFYGMHIVALARVPSDLEAVSDALARQQIKIHTLSRYFLGPPTQSGLVFGYGTVDLPEIRRGISMLRKVASDA